MTIVNMNEKHTRDYYIEYFNNLSLEELKYAKTKRQQLIVVDKNINTHKLLEDFIKPNELVDFKHIHYLLENAKQLGYKPVTIL